MCVCVGGGGGHDNRGCGGVMSGWSAYLNGCEHGEERREDGCVELTPNLRELG